MKNETEIDTAIEALTKKVNENITAGDALHYTQAVLNLANAKGRLKDTEKQS